MAKQKQGSFDLFGNPIEEEPSVSAEMERYRDYVSGFTVPELKEFRRCLGFDFPGGKKRDLVTATLAFLSSLEEKDRFQKWFASLPPYLGRAIEETVFNEYVDAARVEELAGKPVMDERLSPFYRYSSYYQDPSTNPDLRLGIFDLYKRYNRTLLVMKRFFRQILIPRFPPPPHFLLAPCEEPAESGWTVSETLAESMPLLFKALYPLFQDRSRHKTLLRRGLKKGEIKELRKSSAFPCFPRGSQAGLDPIDLVSRFLLIDPNQWEKLMEGDVRDLVKALVKEFLTPPESGTLVNYYHQFDTSFEYAVLCPHLSKVPMGSRLDRHFFSPYPRSRRLYSQILDLVAESGQWYDADEMAESIRQQALTFTFLRNSEDVDMLMLKGESLDLTEGEISVDSWDEGFVIDRYLTYPLITKPLLKGYCYLMAALGILEIEEGEPPRILKKKGKLLPLSPWEGLRRIRITPFGTWCLGLSEAKPPLREISYEAIADKELPLVTYRGHSLECRVYLERIGEPVGEDRFRISEASFIRDCAAPEDVEGRIDDFYRLIVKEPPSHWEALFARIRERARLFEAEEPCRMISLPDDRELRRLFLEEKKLAALVVRAEGGRIVVKEKHYKKLRKLMEGYGVLKR